MSAEHIVVGVVIVIIMILSVFGNVLVCTSVFIVPRLRQPANILIGSLAASDLLVSLLVMPPALQLELSGKWTLGPVACTAWILADVFLCTSSILSLTAICIDRYMAISRPLTYIPVRTPKLMFLCIMLVEITAALVTAPTLAIPRQNTEQVCQVSQSPLYQVYATCCSFYLPLVIMTILYARIYSTARKIIKKEKVCLSDIQIWNTESLCSKVKNMFINKTKK